MSSTVFFLAWNAYNTRNAVIAELLEIPSYHIGSRKKSKLGSLFSYVPKFFRTLRLIRTEKPQAIIVTNSIFVLPAACFLLRLFFRFDIVLDSHSSGIENSFAAYPPFLRKRYARKALLNIVTNEAHAQIVRSWGGKTLVLPDPPARFEINADLPKNARFSICFINTYSDDEPFDEVIRCAAEMPEFDFYITGNPKGRVLPNHANLTYTGFLHRDDYLQLLQKADAILVLTTRENTFQCAGNEALSFSKPLIISGTAYLKQYFGDAAVYVGPDRTSIRNGISELIAGYEDYSLRMHELYIAKTAASREQIALLKQYLIQNHRS